MYSSCVSFGCYDSIAMHYRILLYDKYTKIMRHRGPKEFKVKHNFCELDFCLTVHHQLGKVIQKSQLDVTMIYFSIRSAQHVSGNLLPIIRSVRLRFLQHMVSCCCGGQGIGEWQRAAHRFPTHHNNTIPYAVKISVSRS